MHARAGKLEQVLEGRFRLCHHWLTGTAPAHGDHDDLAVTREQARDVAGDGGLADPLPRPDDGERGKFERLEGDRIEAEVGSQVRKPRCERAARELEARSRVEHRLVGEIDDRLGARRLDPFFERLEEGDAVILAAAELLRPAHKDGPEDLVRHGHEGHADDVRIVLSVNERQERSRPAPHLVLDARRVLLELQRVR